MKLALGQLLSAWREFNERRAALSNFPRGRPLLVTGAYRSGTSWVGRMLAGKGVWHLHEPLNPRHGLWNEYFGYLRPADREPELDGMLRRIKNGSLIGGSGRMFLRGIRSNRPGMPARLGLYRDCIRQILIKDPIACLLAEYFARNHDFRVLLILRHPAGFASSLERLGWDTAAQLRKLLDDEALLEDWLYPYESALRARAGETGLQTHTALYAAIWTVLWGFAQRNNEMQIVNYERLSAAPEREFEILHHTLGLPYEVEDQDRHARLTRHRPSGEVPSAFDVVRNTESTHNAWARRLTPGQIGIVRSVWEAFDVPFFKADADWKSHGDAHGADGPSGPSLSNPVDPG